VAGDGLKLMSVLSVKEVALEMILVTYVDVNIFGGNDRERERERERERGSRKEKEVKRGESPV
jgi:hypothetical protein